MCNVLSGKLICLVREVIKEEEEEIYYSQLEEIRVALWKSEKKKGYDLNVEIRQGKVEYLKRAKVCSEESDKKGKYMNTKYMKLNR